ncbi:hypothetical protein L1887_18424 [Cichorium endivia]|nr:hypothetical protein L1887_18424 [Cichorium endivia]
MSEPATSDYDGFKIHPLIYVGPDMSPGLGSFALAEFLTKMNMNSRHLKRKDSSNQRPSYKTIPSSSDFCLYPPFL